MEPQILDLLRWQRVAARLNALALARPALAAQCAAIRAPVETIARAHRDALLTLDGDPLAAERLAAIAVASAAPAVALLRRVQAAMRGAGKLPDAHAPSLIQLGELALLGVAAARVAPSKLAAYYGAAIHGLALQATPAALLARLEPHGASDDALADLVARLMPESTLHGTAERMQLERLIHDPNELGRWRCLARMFEALHLTVRPSSVAGDELASVISEAVDLSRWSPARADGIASVRERDGAIVLEGALGAAGAQWNEATAVILGASVEAGPRGPRVVTTRATAVVPGDGELEATFDASIDWAGYATQETVAQAQAVRHAVRRQLEIVGKLPCVADPALAHRIPPVPPLGETTDAPPRTPSNQRPVEGPSEPPDPDERGPERLGFVVFRPRVLGPEERRVAREAADAALSRLAIALGAEPEVVELPWAEDPLAVLARPPRDVDDPLAAGLLDELERAAARTPGRERAIWIALVPDTAGALSIGQPGEAALGIAVASPRGAPAAVLAILRGDPPAQVAPAALAMRMVADRPPARRLPTTRGPAPRLRLVGAVRDRAVRLLDVPRLDDDRGAGAGAPHASGLCAVCLDARGDELSRAPVGTQRTGAGFGFVALVAVTDDTEVVELRRDDEVALRVARPAAPLALEVDAAEVEDERLWLQWRLEAGTARAALLEVATVTKAAPLWVPFARVSACAARDLVPTWRLATPVQLRLVATDGWHAAASEVTVDAPVQYGPCVIRRIGASTLWAELPDDAAAPAWEAPAGSTPRGRAIELSPEAAGRVTLRANGIADAIEVEARGHRRP